MTAEAPVFFPTLPSGFMLAENLVEHDPVNRNLYLCQFINGGKFFIAQEQSDRLYIPMTVEFDTEAATFRYKFSNEQIRLRERQAIVNFNSSSRIVRFDIISQILDLDSSKKLRVDPFELCLSDNYSQNVGIDLTLILEKRSEDGRMSRREFVDGFNQFGIKLWQLQTSNHSLSL